MEYIKSLDDFLLEKKVVIKRKYTENHPAKRVSTSARVRNVVLDAMSDGVITEEELQNILQAANAGSRWFKKNSSLFQVTEDEDGIKTFALSKRGSLISTRTRNLNESSKVDDMKFDINSILDILINGDRYYYDGLDHNSKEWKSISKSIDLDDDIRNQLDKMSSKNIKLLFDMLSDYEYIHD